MPIQREIITGAPGTRWVNETPKVRYQFVAALINTCGVCLQYHLKIGPPWPIPIHYGCRCEQRRIAPGAEAPHEFVDFREILDNMSHPDQVAAIGASNYQLLKAGKIKWEDVVTPTRVRDFREVVSNKRFSVKTLVDNGVSPRIAEQAHAAVNTPGHNAVEARRAELAARIAAAGVPHEKLVEELAKGLASRVSIGAGPDTYGRGPAWSGGPVTPRGALDQAARLRAILETMRPRRPLGPAERIRSTKLADDGTITIQTNERTVTIRPGETFEGRTYEEWRRPPGIVPAGANTFGKSRAKISLDAEHPAKSYRDAVKQLFGPRATVRDVVSAAGVPHDVQAVVKLSEGKVGPATEISVWVQTTKYDMYRTIRRDPDGKIVVQADGFHLGRKYQGQGIGADVFGRMVEQSTRLGADRIVTTASKSSEENGYYVWPRFGYDASLKGLESITDRLPPPLKNAKLVSDLMLTPEGREWWKQNGIEMQMTFDLKPGSRSRQVWEAYLKEKKTK